MFSAHIHLVPLQLSSHACLQNHFPTEAVVQQPPSRPPLLPWLSVGASAQINVSYRRNRRNTANNISDDALGNNSAIKK